MVGVIGRLWLRLRGLLGVKAPGPRPDPGSTSLDRIGPPGWAPRPDDVIPRSRCVECGLIQSGRNLTCDRCHRVLPVSHAFPEPEDEPKWDFPYPEDETPEVEVIPAPPRPEDDLIYLGGVVTSLHCPRCKRAKQLHGMDLVAEELTCSECGYVYRNRMAPKPGTYFYEQAMIKAGLVAAVDPGNDNWTILPATPRGQMGPEDEDLSVPDEDEEEDFDIDDDEDEEDFDDDEDEEDDEDEPMLKAPEGVAESFPRLLGFAPWQQPPRSTVNPVNDDPSFPTVPPGEVKVTFQNDRIPDTPDGVFPTVTSRTMEIGDWKFTTDDGRSVEGHGGRVTIGDEARCPQEPPRAPLWGLGRPDV